MELDRDANRKLGARIHGEVWKLLEHTDRSAADTRRMIHAAHASLYHWLGGGTVVNEQRGEWLVARAYTVAGLAEPALRHAQRTVEITDAHPGEMADFDLAFAREGLARALALSGRLDEARTVRQEARDLGNRIADPEDRKIFDADFEGGKWFGAL